MEQMTSRQAFGEALRIYGGNDKRVCVVDSDCGIFAKTSRFAQDFPKRHIQAGAAEQNAVGVAIGMAVMGKVPFIATYATLLLRAFDQIRTLAYASYSVKLVGAHAGVAAGEDGPLHHALSDISLMCGLPNMKVFSPADVIETKQVVQAVLADPGPCYIRLFDHESYGVFDRNYHFHVGKGSVLTDGDDVGIIATGAMTSVGMRAADMLKKDGISVRVINMSSLKPLDSDLILETARKCKRIFTVEDHHINGLGGLVSDVLTTQYPKKLHRVGIKDEWTVFGNWRELYRKYGLDAEGLYAFIKS